MDPLSILIRFAIVLVALTIHEAAHAWTAEKLGDPTARMLGRVSLNPIVHIDPIGTILLPLLSAFSPVPLLGWAKPVPVNLSRLRRGKQDFMLVAAAGPLSNLLQAVVGAVAYRLIGEPGTMTAGLIALYVSTNLLLAFFNLLPVPPLDGGNVLAGVLPESAEPALQFLRQFGFIILYGLMLTGILTEIILPPTLFFQRILLQ